MEGWHPAVVHLPLALGLLWPWVDLCGVVWKRPDLSLAGLGILILGLVSSLVATITGQAAFDRAVAASISTDVLGAHTDDANLVPWMFLALVVIRIVGPLKLKRTGHVAALAFGFASGMLLFQVGKSGGELVFGHGIGVRPLMQTSRSAN